MPRMKKAIKKAGKHAEELKKIAVRSKSKPRPKPTQDRTLIAKVARKLREIYYGPKTYLPKKKKEFKTARTATVESKLKKAGVRKKKVKQLRGKY